MGIDRAVLRETRARGAQPCAHPTTTTISKDVARRLERGGGDVRTIDGYAGREEQPWCIDCGHTLSANELRVHQQRTARRRFSWRLSVALVCSAVALGMGYLLGQSLAGSDWDTGGWLANWLLGTLLIATAALFALALSHAFGSQPD